MVIDLFEFCRQGDSLAGNVSVAELPRLDVARRDGVIKYRLDGGCDAQRKLSLTLDIDGEMWLVCQRCLDALHHRLEIATRFNVVRTEAEADAAPLDEDAADPLVGSEAFNLLDLVEEEVLLSVPLVPRHIACSAITVEEDARHRGAADPPAAFALLAALKTKLKH